MLAPTVPLRSAVTAYGRDEANQHAEPKPGQASSPAAPAAGLCSPARYLWAMLLARLFESLPLVCPHCGADMRIVAFVTEAVPVERILTHIGEPAKPPPITPSRGPPDRDDGLESLPDWGAMAEPEFQIDQRVGW